MDKKEQQYEDLLNKALDKVKSKYEGKIKEFTELQDRKITSQQDQFRAQLEALNQELEVWKNKASVLSNTSHNPNTNVPSDTKLGGYVRMSLTTSRAQ